MKQPTQAEQGIRQKGRPTVPGKKLLLPGDTFVSTRYPNAPETLTIPLQCVGLVHNDGEETISVVYEDCQAAKRFIKKLSS